MSATPPAEMRERVIEVIASRFGLRYTLDRWPELDRSLAAAARDLGLAGVDRLALTLLTDPSQPSIVDAISRHLTVGETYFFRDPTSFEVLRHEILIPLINARRLSGERQLRIWSAGCATGEEAYSIAMTVAELLPDLADWSVTILATDLNRDSLKVAQAATYKKWSFRGASDPLIDRFFEHQPPDVRIVLPRFRNMVTFTHLNLVDPIYPSAATNTLNMDVVLCRNVLIYFSPAQCHAVSARLQAALNPGGWLMASAAEGSAIFAPLVPVAFSGAIVYRKIAASSSPSLPSPSLLAPEQPTPPAEPGPHDNDTPAITPRAPLSRQPEIADLAERSRAKANEGDLHQALELCNLALQKSPLSPRLHFLRASILQEFEHTEEAIVAFRRVIHLDHRYILAYFALGTLMGKKGERARQKHYFERALDLLRDLPSDSIVPDSAGLTAARLAEVIVTTAQ